MGKFEIRNSGFYLNDEPFKVLAGAIHYFRVPREYWRDRLLKLKACGFNTVETYVAWNAHMPREDAFDYTGMLDLNAFLDTAKEVGLWAIVRPGPYICSEWEFGALPWWLLKYDMSLRCADPEYLKHVDAYFDHLIPRLCEKQITRGGNILMMQVENEYGSYGDDDEYLTYVKNGLLSRGVEVPLFTSDGDADFMLTGGTLKEVHKTVNFGSRAKSQFESLRRYQPEGPLMCTEFWNGWFDHWGEEHHFRKPEEAESALREILTEGGSVSAYMFHGGTNFGFMNGANCPGRLDYQPTVSSYDDDAPLNECGDITEKYRLFNKALVELEGKEPAPEFAPGKKAKYGCVRFTKSVKLFDALDLIGKKHKIANPVPMEKLDQGYGFILYSASVKGPREENFLTIQEVRDRAHIFVDGEFKGVQYRNDKEAQVKFSIPKEGVKLDILVENMGRINYGPFIKDAKGITEGVRLGQQFLYGWDAYTLPMDDVSKLKYEDGVSPFDGTPVFLSGTFDAGDEPADTFVKLPGFKKGVIFLNGRPLSRHWEIGPERSAYLPAPFLKKGENELTVLELDGFNAPEAFLDDQMDIG
ncbi:MAG: beta-galactosidase [Clostridia bacterium]|nr:beta-galactosidase [Clostridia bacterium]